MCLGRVWLAALIASYFLALVYGASASADDTPASQPAPSDAQLLSLVDEAKDFRPVTIAGLRDDQEKLGAAIGRLETYLSRYANRGADWRQFLQLRLLASQSKPGTVPNVDALLAVRAKFHSAYPGLELEPFADVRQAVDDLARRTLAMGRTKEAYLNDLKEISEALRNPDHPKLTALSEAADRLSCAGRAPKLIAALRLRFSQPNVSVNISNRFVSTAMTRPIDESSPLRDNILGTSITGTGHTVGWAQAQLVPDPDRGLIETVIHAQNYSRTVGVNGPAVICANGDTQLHGEKTLVVTADGFSSLPAVAQVTTQSRITGIGSTKHGIMDRVVKKAAAKRIPERKAQGDRVAQQHAQRMFRDKVDSQANELLASANDRYHRKLRDPLNRVGAFPQLLRFSTSADYLDVVGLQDGPSGLGATETIPIPKQGADLLVRVHESLFNNTATDMLAGRTLDQPQLDRISMDIVGHVPDRTDDPELHEPWTVTFAEDRPVSVDIDDQQAVIVVRGTKFTSSTRKFEGMRITARYKMSHEGGSLHASRQGDVEVVPIDFVPGRQTLSARQAALLGPIRKRFSRMFQSQFVSDGLHLSGNLARMGDMPASQFSADNGWIVVGWMKGTAESE
jgi:hypothetical protein